MILTLKKYFKPKVSKRFNCYSDVAPFKASIIFFWFSDESQNYRVDAHLKIADVAMTTK